MEIITDFKEFTKIKDDSTFSVMGMNRRHTFDQTHQHLYSYSIGKADKLLATVYDNIYEVALHVKDKKDKENDTGARAPLPSPADNIIDTTWFEIRGFDYVFLSPPTFMNEFLSMKEFDEISVEINRIWEAENYQNYISTWYSFAPNADWVKHVMYRHMLFYVDFKNKKKYINRTYQAVAPDGTWGFIWRAFFQKYCNCTSEIVPILRDETGLPFIPPHMDNRTQEVKDLFASFVPAFNQFRIDGNLTTLETTIQGLVDASQFEMHYLHHWNDTVTLNKDVFEIVVAYKVRENHADAFRLYEYGNGV